MNVCTSLIDFTFVALAGSMHYDTGSKNVKALSSAAHKAVIR